MKRPFRLFWRCLFSVHDNPSLSSCRGETRKQILSMEAAPYWRFQLFYCRFHFSKAQNSRTVPTAFFPIKLCSLSNLPSSGRIYLREVPAVLKCLFCITNTAICDRWICLHVSFLMADWKHRDLQVTNLQNVSTYTRFRASAAHRPHYHTFPFSIPLQWVRCRITELSCKTCWMNASVSALNTQYMYCTPIQVKGLVAYIVYGWVV